MSMWNKTALAAIVCAMLYWLAYQPVLRMLEERRKQIAMGVANTEKINAALAGIEAQRQGVMADAHAQGQKFLADAREAAKRLQEQEAQGRLVVQTTAAVVGKVLTPDDQRRLSEETAKRLSA